MKKDLTNSIRSVLLVSQFNLHVRPTIYIWYAIWNTNASLYFRRRCQGLSPPVYTFQCLFVAYIAIFLTTEKEKLVRQWRISIVLIIPASSLEGRSRFVQKWGLYYRSLRRGGGETLKNKIVQNGCYKWLLTVIYWALLVFRGCFLAMFLLLEVAITLGSHDHIR